MVFLTMILSLMLCFSHMFNHLFPCSTVPINFFRVCGVMHCKHHKLSRWALFASRANVAINIVYKKKNTQFQWGSKATMIVKCPSLLLLDIKTSRSLFNITIASLANVPVVINPKQRTANIPGLVWGLRCYQLLTEEKSSKLTSSVDSSKVQSNHKHCQKETTNYFKQSGF